MRKKVSSYRCGLQLIFTSSIFDQDGKDNDSGQSLVADFAAMLHQGKSLLYQEEPSIRTRLRVNVTYEQLKALVAHNKDLVLIDVRSQEEINRGCIPGSIHIPIQTVDAALAMTPDEFKAKYGVTKPALGVSELVFYCQSGGRGARATNTAREKGYINARNYAGAYSEWSKRQRN